MVKAIIFDFDGVICSSEHPRFAFYQKAFAEYGITYPDSEFEKMMGMTSVGFLQKLDLPGLTKEIKDAVYDEYVTKFRPNIVNYVHPITPIVSFIKEYKGSLRFAITSGSPHSVIKQVTEAFAIADKFEAILGKEEIGRFKPFPDAYINAAKALEVTNKEYISIEDSPVGAMAAIDAGADCYIVLNGVNNKNEFQGIPVKGFIMSTEDIYRLLD